MSAGFALRHVVGFRELSMDVFLEVQNTKYSYTLYLIDFIVHGLHLWNEIEICKEIYREPIVEHPGVCRSLHCDTFVWF